MTVTTIAQRSASALRPANLHQHPLPGLHLAKGPTSKAARFALCALLGFFGIKTNGCLTTGVFHKPSRLSMRDNSTGAAGVALFAAMHAQQAAKEGEFSFSFLPPEQRSQKDARRRPNKDQWLAAEDKELNTLGKMEPFEVVDLPDDYDPLPLQFVYKFKIKDRDFDNCIYKARLVPGGTCSTSQSMAAHMLLQLGSPPSEHSQPLLPSKATHSRSST
jgi:hypothetical protein